MNNDLISRSALKKALRNPNDKRYLSESIISLVFDRIDDTPTVEPEKVLVANVTFDEDKLKEIVHTEVIEKIKSGELVISSEERPQGEWIEQKLRNDIVVKYAFKCSKCKQDNGLYYRTDFCPNCGAKMKQG